MLCICAAPRLLFVFICARLIEQLQIGVLPDGGNHLIQKESAQVVDPRFQVLIKQKIGGTLWRWVFRDGTAA